MKGPLRFDRAYYDRFYRRRRTRVASPESTALLVDFVASYLRLIGLSPGTALDLGCGLGYWKKPLQRHFPRLVYQGVEISDYLCAEYGYEKGSVVDYRCPAPQDLVVCQGVLQYLAEREAKKGIRNLARLCGGALYLETLTAEDWEDNVDQELTDGDVHLRPAAWYRRELGRHFFNCGGGLFVPRETPLVLYELERLD